MSVHSSRSLSTRLPKELKTKDVKRARCKSSSRALGGKGKVVDRKPHGESVPVCLYLYSHFELLGLPGSNIVMIYVGFLPYFPQR